MFVSINCVNLQHKNVVANYTIMKRTYHSPEMDFYVVDIPSILVGSEPTGRTSVKFDGTQVDIFSGDIQEGNAEEAASRCGEGSFWDDEM